MDTLTRAHELEALRHLEDAVTAAHRRGATVETPAVHTAVRELLNVLDNELEN
jgi:hypothetical protein